MTLHLFHSACSKLIDSSLARTLCWDIFLPHNCNKYTATEVKEKQKNFTSCYRYCSVWMRHTNFMYAIFQMRTYFHLGSVKGIWLFHVSVMVAHLVLISALQFHSLVQLKLPSMWVHYICSCTKLVGWKKLNCHLRVQSHIYCMVKCFFLHKMKLYFSMFILLLLKKKIGQISCICMQCLYVGTSEYLLLLACLYQILGLLRMSAQTVLIRPNSTTALYSTKTQLMIYQFSSFIRLSLLAILSYTV